MSIRESDIAVIGMSGEFPGAKDISAFWSNLLEGKESITTLFPSDLSASGISNDVWSKANYVPRVGILDDIDQFAADFFGYSPREAALMDPQQRKLLEHAWLALEDAAINPLQYDGLIGVMVSSSLNTYLMNHILRDPSIRESDDIQQVLFGNGVDYLATRIAYQLNCRGAALNIQTACSSSLVAVHEACQQLLTYQIDVAVAGGVSISIPQKKGYLYGVDGLFSEDGHCRPFSDDANGTLFSNGLGVIVLKRVQDALADGNPIYAVIRGSAVNNDGQQKVGYTAPSIEGQADVIAMAHATAEVLPEEIAYIEAHGTGTSLGDPIELQALQQVFSEQTTKKQFCTLGSVKSNLGHLDVASGIVGLMKAILVVKNRLVPATLHFGQGTSKFNWRDGAFKVSAMTTPLQVSHELAIAGVSSFGIGGTNAHVVIAEHQTHEHPPLMRHGATTMLCFSAKTESALKEMLVRFVRAIQHQPEHALASIARTLQEGRAAYRYRTVLLVDSLAEAIQHINQQKYVISVCEQDLGKRTVLPFDQCQPTDLQEIAQQWLEGYRIDWRSHYQHYQPGMVHLPGYPFERASHWLAISDDNASSKQHSTVIESERSGLDDWFYQPTWQPAVLSQPIRSYSDKTVLVMMSREFETLIGDALQPVAAQMVKVYPSMTYQQVDATTYEIDIDNPQHYRQLLSGLRELNQLPDFVLHALSLTKSGVESSVSQFREHQSVGLLSLLYLAQAYDVICQGQTLDVTVITNRLNHIAEGAIEPHKAPIMAAVKVMPKEFPSIQAQLIDIDCIDYPQYQAHQMRQLIQDIYKSHYTDEELLYRGITRWQRTYTLTPLPKPCEPHINRLRSKVIVIVGGLGQLGLDIADYFSQFTGIQLVLLARKSIGEFETWGMLAQQYEPSHPKRLMLERLIAMRSRGCDVHAYSVDIADAQALASVIQQVEDKFGSIHGVIHAAGETVNGMMSIKTAASLDESYQAKVYGTYHLCELFLEKSFDFMILCSSMNAIIGGLGQLDNTAANITIDYLADYYAAKTGRSIMSINWGAINMDRPLKVNVVPQFAELSTEHKRNRMTDAETHAVYSRILTYPLGPRLVISTLPMQDVLMNWNRVAALKSLDRELAVQGEASEVLSPENMPRTSLEKWIADVWSKLLGISPMSRQAHFFDLGGHSLSAVQFMTRLLEEYQLKVHVMVLYEKPTLAEFATHIEGLR